jgi:HK97 family phage portal protein
LGWLDKIFSKAKRPKNANMNLNVSMKGYEPTFTAFGEITLQSDIILSAIKMKQRFFGKLDPRHIRIRDDKTELVTDSSVARLMRQPNDFQTPYDFLTQAWFMREKDNNCFIYPDYYISNAGQKIYTGMYILLPTSAPIIEQDESGNLFLRFLFLNPAREVVFPYEDIIVWKQDMEDNQFLGGGRYDRMADSDLLNSLSAYHTAKEAVAEASKLGCYLDGIIKVNAYVAADEKAQKIRDQFISDLRTNKSGVGVLDMGAEYQDIHRSLKMVDAATLAEIKNNVLLHLGVTMDMLQGKFTEADKEAFYENHIEPAAISLGQAMEKVFFSQWQTSYGDRIEMYPKKIRLMSTSEITKVVQSTINAGVFTLDEYREMYGYAPLPNEEGKQRPRGFNNLDGGQPSINPDNVGVSADAEQDIVEDVQDVVKTPLLVGQIQSLTQIIADYQTGKYTYNQALNMLEIGIGLTEAEATKLLDKQDDELIGGGK